MRRSSFCNNVPRVYNAGGLSHTCARLKGLGLGLGNNKQKMHGHIIKLEYTNRIFVFACFPTKGFSLQTARKGTVCVECVV